MNAGFNRHTYDSINIRAWVGLLVMYRTLRIRIPYAAPGSPALDGGRASGCSYGMTRNGARDFLAPIARELDWYDYLGSK